MPGDEGECGLLSNRMIGPYRICGIETFSIAGGVEDLDDEDGAFPVDPVGRACDETFQVSLSQDSNP